MLNINVSTVILFGVRGGVSVYVHLHLICTNVETSKLLLHHYFTMSIAIIISAPINDNVCGPLTYCHLLKCLVYKIIN